MGSCWHETVAAAPANNANQLNGYCYDAAGNLALNTGSCPQPPGTSFTPIYAYDSENRLSSTAGYSYFYDADGVRMEKSSGSSGTMYWTGPGGEYLTETDLTGTINEEYIYFGGQRLARIDRPSGTVHYYFSDHLGSASVITDSAGNVQQRDYYYPYGGIVAAVGSDPNHYKFTGKERDSESNLDEFGARYYSSNIGRFMTPDWAARPIAVPYAVFGDPQTLNLYSYVENGPINRADADGHWQGPYYGSARLDEFGPCDSGNGNVSANCVYSDAASLSNDASTAAAEGAAQQNTQLAAQYTTTPLATVVPYPAHGATAEEAMTDAKTNGPNAPYAGSTAPGNVSAQPTVTECGAGICTANVTAVSFGQITISAPQWAEFSQASKSEQSNWTSSLNSLIKHENGHVKDALDIHAREGFALEHLGATGSTGAAAIQNLNSEIRAVFNQYNNLGRQWGASYDQRTCHGTCQY